MSRFEGTVRWELSWLLRAGAPPRAMHLTVHELMFAELEQGRLGGREVNDAVEAAVRAACRLVRELDAPEDLIDLVCRAALTAVRGHGGGSARWLADATMAADAVIAEQARAYGTDRSARWADARSPHELHGWPGGDE